MDSITFAKLKKGDRVKVVQHPSQRYVGKTGTVYHEAVSGLVGITMDCDQQSYLYYHYEIEALNDGKIVLVGGPKSVNKYPHKCPRPSCGSPAYVGFCDVDCTRCGRY